MTATDTLVVHPGGCLEGSVVVPGDKSISHRAVMFSALADGISDISDCLMGEDVVSTINAFRHMGVQIDQVAETRLRVLGVGVDGLKSPPSTLYLGNSGTSMRLLAGLLAGAGIRATLTGDASLSKRPMRRVSEPLTMMGAGIETSADGTPPVTLNGQVPLTAIDYDLPVASAQVKAAVLLAGLFAAGRTSVHEPAPTRDHTERMLRAFNVDVEVSAATVSIVGGQRLRPVDVVVPSDISSAAFFMLGASIAAGSQLRLPAVGMNPTRTGVIEILRAMSANIRQENPREISGEPVSDLSVNAAELRGCVVPPELVPLAIDEFPAIFVAAACAEGTTVVREAEELRHKESDRIEAMATGLRALGIDVETYPDGIAIEGGVLRGGEVDAMHDHRIAMAFAMAALRADGPVVIRNAAAIATSFPNFYRLACTAGLRLETPASP